MRPAAAFLLIGAACAPTPTATPAPGTLEGAVHVGLDKGAPLAQCGRDGTWQVVGSGFSVVHWIEDAEGRKIEPRFGGLQSSLYRGVLPLPQITWGGSNIEVTQLLYPAGEGFVARYHVMNHGSEASRCRLLVAVPGAKRDGRALRLGAQAAILAADEPADADGALAFDLAVEPGTSKFVAVTTSPLGGKIPADALDAAAGRWEKALDGRRLSLPDPAATAAYHADLGGAILGIAGCAEAVARMHDRLARRDGDALRILPDAPADWLGGSIEAAGLPTDFGTLTLQLENTFTTRTIDLGGSCRPPGGFKVAIPAEFRVRIDGKDAAAPDGVLSAPAGTRQIEMVRRFQ